MNYLRVNYVNNEEYSFVDLCLTIVNRFPKSEITTDFTRQVIRLLSQNNIDFDMLRKELKDCCEIKLKSK